MGMHGYTDFGEHQAHQKYMQCPECIKTDPRNTQSLQYIENGIATCYGCGNTMRIEETTNTLQAHPKETIEEERLRKAKEETVTLRKEPKQQRLFA